MFARSTESSRRAEILVTGQLPIADIAPPAAQPLPLPPPTHAYTPSVNVTPLPVQALVASAPVLAAVAPPAEIVSAPANKVSVIGNDLTILGQGITIISKGSIQLDGAIHGNLHATDIVIGEKGRVDGLIAAETIVIRGTVTGTIRALRVALQDGARVDGEIQHQTLTIDANAHFDGRVRRPQNVDELMPNLDPAAHDIKRPA